MIPLSYQLLDSTAHRSECVTDGAVGAPTEEGINMSTYHVVKADGTQIGDAHSRRRGAVGSAVIALAEGLQTGTLTIVKRKPGFTDVERATLARAEDGLFSISVSHDVAQPLEAVEPVEPVADGE
jgi:hypothetical protein